MSNSDINYIFESISKQNMAINQDNQLLHLICHDILRKAGYRCIYEETSSIPGFAPAIKPIPSNCFVPPTWNVEELQFRYTHSRNASMKYELITFLEDEKNATISIFIEPTGKNDSMHISLSEYFDDSKPINERLIKPSELIDKIKYFISSIPQIEANPKNLGPTPQLPQRDTSHLPRPPNSFNEQPNFHNDTNHSPSLINPQINQYTGRYEFVDTHHNHPFGGDFSGDINPFGNGPAGNMMGPEYFQRPQNLPDGVPPNARFDPFDPLHPNGPFQKKGKPNLFGVPDPDHLKPPRGGPNDNDLGGFGF